MNSDLKIIHLNDLFLQFHIYDPIHGLKKDSQTAQWLITLDNAPFAAAALLYYIDRKEGSAR